MRLKVAFVMATFGACLTVTACSSNESADPAPELGTQSDAPKANDLTADLQQASNGAKWSDAVVTATQTEPGRIKVATSLVDPRGAAGSPAAQQAVAICEAAVGLLEQQGAADPYVSVFESDGTTWVVYGNPAYPDGCTEV